MKFKILDWRGGYAFEGKTFDSKEEAQTYLEANEREEDWDEYKIEQVKYIIQDWAGNHLYKGKEFDSFDEGWKFLYVEKQDEFDADEEAAGEYYVVPKKK